MLPGVFAAVDAAFVEGLVRLFEQSSLAELEYSEAGGDRLRLKRGGTPVPSPAGPSPRSPAAFSAAPDAVARAGEPGPEPAAGPVTVAASVHGAFYRGPAPGQPPFVQPGDAVEEGQTLAILEAMKVLNKVEAPHAGRVVAVLAADGDTVAAGTALFTLDPAG